MTATQYRGGKSTRRRPAEERFWEKVEKTDGCWLWRGAVRPGGYGTFYPTRKKSVGAHVFAYELTYGPVPAGLWVDHVKERGCTNRNCVNPAHLEAVTPQVNILRGDSPAAIAARRNACPNGHPLDERNTYRHPSGARRCRTCESARSKARRVAA